MFILGIDYNAEVGETENMERERKREWKLKSKRRTGEEGGNSGKSKVVKTNL